MFDELNEEEIAIWELMCELIERLKEIKEEKDKQMRS